MDLRDLVLLLKRFFSVIVICTFVGLSFSIHQTSKAVPLYESKVTVFVATPPSLLDLGGPSKIGELTTGNAFSQARVKSYATIVNNPETLQPVIEQLQLSYSVSELVTKVRASAVTDTVLIEIFVTDPDPTLAAEIANSVATNFSETVQFIELNTSTDLSQLIRLSIVKAAVPNLNPIYPRKAFNYVVGLFSGGLIGFGYALLRKVLDQALKTEGDLGDTPLVGVIAFDNGARTDPLTLSIDTYSARTEAFRIVRTNLLHVLDKIEDTCLLVTSCFSGEGKSTGSINLAFAISQAGYKVLVIEADLRRPSFKKYSSDLRFDLRSYGKGDSGLSSLLNPKNQKITKKMLLDTVQGTKMPNLFILQSGPEPANPAEMLGGERFIQLIEIAKRNFDYVVIDTPPALSVADATIVARRVRNVVLFIHAGQTTKRSFQAAKAALHDVDVNITGAILNKVPSHKRGEVYGYTYSGRNSSDYYRYSYAYGKDAAETDLDRKLNYATKFTLLRKFHFTKKTNQTQLENIESIFDKKEK